MDYSGRTEFRFGRNLLGFGDAPAPCSRARNGERMVSGQEQRWSWLHFIRPRAHSLRADRSQHKWIHDGEEHKWIQDGERSADVGSFTSAGAWWIWAGIRKKTGLLVSLRRANFPVAHGWFFLPVAYDILQSPTIFLRVMRWRT